MEKKKTHFLMIGLGALVLSACSSPQDAPPAPASSRDPVVPTRVTKEVVTGADIVLPMDAYVESPQQARVNDLAVAQLARSCMTELGFEWPAPRDERSAPTDPMNGRRYGVMDVSVARTWGYHSPVTREGEEHTESEENKARPSTKAIEAYTGRRAGEALTPNDGGATGGCRGDAEKQVYGKQDLKPQWVELMQYHHRSFLDASRDARVTRAMADWRSCMTAFGYRYTDIWDVNNDPRWQSATAGRTERLTAERDVGCKARSRLPSVLLAVESELQTEHIQRNSDEFAQIKDYFIQAGRRSSAVVNHRAGR